MLKWVAEPLTLVVEVRGDGDLLQEEEPHWTRTLILSPFIYFQLHKKKNRDKEANTEYETGGACGSPLRVSLLSISLCSPHGASEGLGLLRRSETSGRHLLLLLLLLARGLSRHSAPSVASVLRLHLVLRTHSNTHTKSPINT